MAILVFAGVLSIPSAVFAEASWYGSLRVGVQSSDSKISVVDGASRWGIKGSVDAGDGLTGVYRFETKIGANNAQSSGSGDKVKVESLGLDKSGGPGGRLSYVGLSGAFGTVTLGQIWSASFNATGAMTDNSNYYGDSETTYRHGNVVSYAFSNDLMSLQADLVYDDGKAMVDTNGTTDGGYVNSEDDPMEDLESAEFGLTINVGDNAAVAVSHWQDKYSVSDNGTNADGTDSDSFATWKTKGTIVVAQLSVTGVTVYAGKKKESYDMVANLTAAGTALFRADDETTFFGARGSLGDTGMGYVFQWRDKDTYKPWTLTLNKGLGDSTTLSLEHANNDNNVANKTQLGLKINF